MSAETLGLSAHDYSDNVSVYLTKRLLLIVEQDMHHFDSTLHDVGARAKDGSNTSLIKVVIVLHGDHTTSGDDDILTTQLLELLDNGGNKGLVTSGE